MRLRSKALILFIAVLLVMSSTVVFGEMPIQPEVTDSVNSQSTILPNGGQAPPKSTSKVTLESDLNQIADDLVDDVSATSIIALVERFEEEGEFANYGTARSLLVHLISVDRFENQGETDKVVKHMKSFNLLLDYQKDNELISENAYNILKNNADALIKKFNVSQPKYSYEDAIRETVYVNTTLDSDENGQPDQIAVDIIRPRESRGRNKSAGHYRRQPVL